MTIAIDPQAALDELARADAAAARPRRTLRSSRAEGRDPFAVFRAEEALLVDAAWLGRVASGGPLLFWDDDELPMGRDAYTVTDGVATVRVDGPLSQRGFMCFTGYDTVARNLQAALDDSSVAAVVLAINSPGGAAAGCFEAVRGMRAAIEASGKRVVAYSDEIAFSGGYAIACVADEIVVPETGGVGSVGVIAGMQSAARALAAEGIDVRVFTAGAEKADGHPALPITKEAEVRAQARVDELAGVFHRWVSARRPLSVEAVGALEAGVRYGDAAVTSGLADRVASLADVVASLRPAAPTKPTAPAMRPGPTRPAARASRNPMDESLLSAIAALTGSNDPAAQVAALAKLGESLSAATGLSGATVDAQVGALAALSAKATGYDAAIARAEAAEQAAQATALEQLIAQGQADGKLTPAQVALAEGTPGTDDHRPAGWARRQSPESLAAFLADAPRVIPRGAVKGPAEAPTDDVQLPPSLAALAEKGWAQLADLEKHALMQHDPKLAARLRDAAKRAA